MEYIKCGELILLARKEKGYTQQEVAKRLNVSNKTVSKWERGLGCPDVRILSELSDVLEIDAKVLLSGIASCNEVNNGNLKKLLVYVCPSCGNILTSTGPAEIACCGKKMKELQTGKEDEDHTMHCEKADGELYVRMEKHPMTKNHFISFFCYVTGDKISFIKLYPEQNCEARFRMNGHGFLYAYCMEHGLYKKVI